MSGLRSTTAAGARPDRNDPCPCGSGLKYKKCCAIRPRIAQAVQAPAARLSLGALTTQGREVAGSAIVNRAVRAGSPPAAATPAERPSQALVSAPGPAPSAAAARFRSDARRLLGMGRLQESLPQFRQAVRLDPNNARLRQELGSALLDSGDLAEAVDNLATATRLDPKLAMARFRLGLAFSRQGRVSEAVTAYQGAIAVAPRLTEAHFELGMALYLLDFKEAAAKAFDKAAEAAPGTSDGRTAAAWALIARNRREEAIIALRRARALDPTSDALAHLLARALAEAGRIDEAEEELVKALAVIPTGTGLWQELTMLRKMTPEDRPLVERMTRVLQADGLNGEKRAMLHFALGKLHDDLREFGAAMGHYDAANRVRAGTRMLDRGTMRRTVDRLIAQFPRGIDWEGLAHGSDDEAPVLIVGMPRSGSTLVEQILSSHPKIAAGGELRFWTEYENILGAREAGEVSAEVLQPLAARYLAGLRRIAPEAPRITDKNLFNFMHLGLVRQTLPRAFIIHCRRHPVDNCISIYSANFADAMLSFTGNREDLVFYYRQYQRLMQHWHEVLPPERFITVDYERLVSDRETETRRLISFCKLEWNDACLRPEANRRAVATASVWQARQPVYRTSMERWRNYQPWLGAFAELMPPAD